MDILKSFCLLDKEYKINIIGTLDEPLFQANHIANILEMKRINDSISDFDDTEKILKLTNTPGGVQKSFFLTEIGLYKLILRSRKPIAKTFQKWVCNIIKELRLNENYKLKEENEIEKNLLIYKGDIEKHKQLIKIFDNKNTVYICKFKKENDKLLIKIGSSQNIKERISHMANSYENIEPILIDLVEINNYKKFEDYLHNHEFIKKFYYQFANKQGKISKETYLIDEIYLNDILKIFNNDKDKFIETNYENLNIMKEVEELKIEKEKLKINKLNELKEIKKIDLKINDDNKFKELEDKIINIEEKINKELLNKDIDNEINIELENIEEDEINSDNDDIDLTTIYFNSKKQSYSTKMPRVYQYNPDNLTEPIKIYESPSDVERDPNLKNLEISPTPLRNASKNNTIYKGYRWLFVNRNEQPPITIPDTIENKHKEPEIKFIAMIDITQTKILQVFPNQKEAAKARLMKANSFHRAIKNGSISSGHYWKYFENCTIEMQNEYLKDNSLPEKYISPCGKKVQQICPITKNILKTYDSNRDVIKQFKMSVTSLKKYSESGEIHNGYIWKIC